jgi:predicted ATPase
MSITAITIENFKGIKDPVRIEMKPITLLFGPNSVGKSTVIQALHYAREIFERNNCDPDKTIAGGDTIDLGGFKNLVYGQLKQGNEIALGFELDLSKKDLPDYKKGYEDLEHWMATQRDDEIEQDNIDFFINVHDRVKKAVVKIIIRWSEILGKPLVVSYKVGINGTEFAEIEASSDSKQISLAYLKSTHPIFYSNDEWEEYQTHYNDLKIKLNRERLTTEEIEKILLIMAKHGLTYRLCQVLDDELINPLLIATGKAPLSLNSQTSALPNWGRPIELDIKYCNKETSYYEYGFFFKMISSLIFGPGELIKEELQNICYLGPIREIPTRNHRPNHSPDKSRWANGLAAYDTLLFNDSGFVENVNNWLSREDRLNSGYEIVVKRYRELENEHPLLLALHQKRILDDDEGSTLYDSVLKLPIKKRLLFREKNTEIELSLQDIGVGISQVLPVIVAALSAKSGIVAIEQPELHIHPAFQVVLGDLFIEQIRERPDVTFILETHSEHLLLRLLRRIRETSNGEAPADLKLKPSDLSINFIEQGKEGVVCTTIGVDEEGDFTDRWPRGFFAERSQELFG